MSATPPVRIVDTRGMRCPWPALRLARAVRGDASSARYLVLADDPRAAQEIEALAAVQGWHFVAESDGFHIRT